MQTFDRLHLTIGELANSDPEIQREEPAPMSDPNIGPQLPPGGWFFDEGVGRMRWWDGYQWSDPQPPTPSSMRLGFGPISQVGLSLFTLTGLGLVIWAATLAFLPLPTQLGGLGYCGPGTSSESAISVRLNPDSVNERNLPLVEGQTDSRTEADKAAFKELCVGVANSRIRLVSVLGVVGLVLVGATLALWITRPEWMP